MRELGTPNLSSTSGTNVQHSLRLHTPDKLFPPSCRANKNNEFTRLCCSGSSAAIITSYQAGSDDCRNRIEVFASVCPRIAIVELLPSTRCPDPITQPVKYQNCMSVWIRDV